VKETTTKPQILGLSSDLRTNRWRIICPACGKAFEPQTTMFNHQSLQCPSGRCGKQMVADYDCEVVFLNV
jgi:rRNA maturation endonuclease Nob1